MGTVKTSNYESGVRISNLFGRQSPHQLMLHTVLRLFFRTVFSEPDARDRDTKKTMFFCEEGTKRRVPPSSERLDFTSKRAVRRIVNHHAEIRPAETLNKNGF